MRISSFGQNSSQQISSFKLSKQVQEESTTSAKKSMASSDVPSDNTFYDQDLLEFQIEKNINESSRFLHDGLVKLFDRGASLLAGRSSVEYEEHIKKLSKAIEGQDYKNAEKYIDSFFSGDTDKLMRRVKSLAKLAEDKFWHGMDNAISYLQKSNAEYNLEIDDQKFENITAHQIAKIAISRVRESKEDFSEQDFESVLTPLREKAVAHAKGKFTNAGQNKYTETADSITQSAADYSRNKIFNTDDVNIKEDDKELADIYALQEGDEVTREQIDRLKHRNTRKSDSFSNYMRESSDDFVQEFSKLMYAAQMVKENDMPAESEVRSEIELPGISNNGMNQLKNNISALLPPEYSIDSFIKGSDVVGKYAFQQNEWNKYFMDSGKEG
ncbi:hypothetical protein [Maridesulfovibrio sp.]|uniref:hypothetical protein n=1 Tax=Maridesulfovibrio sp. TaxID=2795000 RepID=UPI0029CAA6C7|nr:hypothetical protein [Maridesulfovibrio sp.]